MLLKYKYRIEHNNLLNSNQLKHIFNNITKYLDLIINTNISHLIFFDKIIYCKPIIRNIN